MSSSFVFVADCAKYAVKIEHGHLKNSGRGSWDAKQTAAFEVGDGNRKVGRGVRVGAHGRRLLQPVVGRAWR